MRPTLLFVYNADSGLFNTVTDIAHKILSPQTYSCNLCALTHGHFKVREDWVRFLETLDADSEFLHRDEFHAHYGLADIALPAIFRKTPEGLQSCIEADTLRNCASLDELKSLLVSRLTPN
ncbi:MAG: hypothetical protein HZB57_13805 [Gammaproteobacteria bacterium]|nr:hypothetical protein [Gammaproteobacteria bacterium]